MNNRNMITIRNKTTGEVKVVPRSQFVTDDSDKGVSGIAQDIGTSLATLPEAAGNLVSSIPGGVSNVLKYATSTNPASTLANIGAGGVESGAALLSSPQMLLRYLSDKFPQLKQFAEKGKTPDLGGINDPTIYESLMNFEKNKGLAPQSDQEASVRNLGGLLFGGKAITSLPNMLTRTGTIAAQQAGAGGDPVHAAILSAIGDKLATSNLPSKMIGAPISVPETLSSIKSSAAKIPEKATQALASALESGADVGSKIPVAGSVLQPTIGALASYLQHLSVSPEEMAQRKLFGDVEPEDLPTMQERDEAGKRLGLTYLTPSELMDSPFESAKQATVGRTQKGMKLLFKLGKDREASEESAINKLFDSIHTDKLNPIKKAAYEDTMNREVTPEFIESQVKNPAIQTAMKRVNNNSAFKQLIYDEYGVSDPDEVPKNKVMYWDFVKRALYDLESKSGRTGSKTEPSVYSDVRNKMVNELDKIAPRYPEARNIAERGFTRKKLEDVFDKKDKNFNNFDSFLKSKENYNNTLEKLDAFPEAKQQLQDIKLFSGKMIPNNPKIRAEHALKRLGMTDPRNTLEAQKRELDEKYGQEHDIAAVKLMTNPDLLSILSKRLGEKS
jgi:hypothetical protein